MKKIRLVLFFVCLVFTANSQEVIYHVFQRSFFDSNGDGQGDLKGIQQKLDYLQELGVTSILLTPLYQSDFYHNYFATDFEKIDPEYGTMADYLALVKEVHKRKMKIYQDVEMQYVTQNHPWFKESFNNPKSKYSKYLFYTDSLNQKPLWVFNIPEVSSYDGSKHRVPIVNMKNPEIRKYTFDVLNFWIDPNHDGKFDDGVDGFRLDHMMDNLDNFNKLPDLFKTFWTPLLTDLRKTNPAIIIMAEQANWFTLGHEYFSKGNVDEVFAFRLSWAIESFNKKKLTDAADSTLNYNPENKNQIVFIENHDTRRFASVRNMTTEKSKVAATLNLLIGGVPLIYYGQELGMKGLQGKGASDGNDISVREAFEWYRSANGKGMAFWYKNTGPWWDSTKVKSNDGISFEEERKDPNSLWNHYKKMIALKKSTAALYAGKYVAAQNNNDNVFSFIRSTEREKILVATNLSSSLQHSTITLSEQGGLKSANSLLKKETRPIQKSELTVDVEPYGILVLRLE
jgi:glycosidase